MQTKIAELLQQFMEDYKITKEAISEFNGISIAFIERVVQEIVTKI